MNPNVTQMTYSIFYFIFLIGAQVAPIWGSAIMSSEDLATHHNPCIREDYVHTPGVGHHKFHTAVTTWYEAKKICEDENAHLAVINSEEEHDVLQEVLKREWINIKNSTDERKAYLGINDLEKEGEWVSIIGDSQNSPEYRKWCPGEPNNLHKVQHCGTLFLNCGMDDMSCDLHRLAFFCELPDHCDSLPPDAV